MIQNQNANLNQQSAQPAPLPPLESALSGLHAEIGHLEQMAAALGQRVVRVLEPNNDTGAGTQGATAAAPAPNTVKSTVDSASSRVAEVRIYIQDLLDRLHI